MRGRVMALYAMAFLGTTPIGAPLVGAIAQWTNPRVALLTGAVATVFAAGLLMWRHQAGLAPCAVDPGRSGSTVAPRVADLESSAA